MVLGQNITGAIWRQVQGSDDNFGGSSRTETLQYSGVGMRIDRRSFHGQQEPVGYEAARQLQAVITDNTLVIKEQDIIIPDDGPYSGKKLLVQAVFYDNIRQPSARSHIELYLSRIEESRDRY